MKTTQETPVRNPTPNLQAVGTGFIALDVILDSQSAPLATEVGGSAGNVLAALAYLGWNSVPVCELGKDNAGERVLKEFKKLKADMRFMVESTRNCTPVVFQRPATYPETHSFSFHCPFCNERHGYSAPSKDNLSSKVLENIPSPTVYYFDRVNPVSLSLAESYRSKGVLVVFEPSVLPKDEIQFQRAVSASHILKYADNRFDYFNFDVSNALLEIRTRGSDGLEFRMPNKNKDWGVMPALKVSRVADTSGAGDWCTVGMIYSLFHSGIQSSLEITTRVAITALRFGQTLAAINCMHFGARGMTKNLSPKEFRKLAIELLSKPNQSLEEPIIPKPLEFGIDGNNLCCDNI